jgi:hypothetical protein
MLIAPPERNMDVSQWKELAEQGQVRGDGEAGESATATGDPELEAFRRRLEGLL